MRSANFASFWPQRFAPDSYEVRYGDQPAEGGADIRPLMICPKCSHEQDDTTQCAACGIYFAKFHAAVKPPPTSRSRAATQEPGIGLGAIAGTAIFTALLVFI